MNAWNGCGYCAIVCALTIAFQWALVRPLEMKTRLDMASGHKKRMQRLRLLGK
jgi:hypothetical protein